MTRESKNGQKGHEQALETEGYERRYMTRERKNGQNGHVPSSKHSFLELKSQHQRNIKAASKKHQSCIKATLKKQQSCTKEPPQNHQTTPHKTIKERKLKHGQIDQTYGGSGKGITKWY